MNDSPQSEGIQPLKGVGPVARSRSGRRSSRNPIVKFFKRIGRRIHWRFLITTFFSIVVVLTIGSIVLATDALNRVNSATEGLNRVVGSLVERSRTELTLLDFQRLEASIQEVQDSIATAKRQIFFLRPFSSFNSDLNAFLVLADAAELQALAGQQMLRGLQPTLFFLVGGDEDNTLTTQFSSGERVIELLRIGRTQFIAAGEYLDRADGLGDLLSQRNLSTNVLLNIETLRQYGGQLRVINDLLVNAPDMLNVALGLDETQSYLILAQNSDELRPSGGYISTYGWMTVNNGRIVDYDYSPTTSTSPTPPAVSSQTPFQVPPWWIQYTAPLYAAWDGSWYADFPSTAQMAKWYYDGGNNPQSPVDGVLAIDTAGFEYLLQALGEVDVPSYEVVVTAENFRQLVYDIRTEGDLAHKRFIAAMYQQIFSEWQNIDGDAEQSTELLNMTLRALQEKHIMFYFADTTLNDAIRTLGWAGAQQTDGTHDYLLLADANLGNKSNRSINRQVTYDVDIQSNGTINARTTINYDYSQFLASADPAVNPQFHGPADYANLMQLYVPNGSVLTSSEDAQSVINTAVVNNLTVFSSRLRVPLGGGERIQFTYTTPLLVQTVGTNQRYRLLVQKQPGALLDAVNVQIQLPPGATLISSQPEPAASYSLERPILEYRLELLADVWIDVVFQSAG